MVKEASDDMSDAAWIKDGQMREVFEQARVERVGNVRVYWFKELLHARKAASHVESEGLQAVTVGYEGTERVNPGLGDSRFARKLQDLPPATRDTTGVRIKVPTANANGNGAHREQRSKVTGLRDSEVEALKVKLSELVKRVKRAEEQRAWLCAHADEQTLELYTRKFDLPVAAE